MIYLKSDVRRVTKMELKDRIKKARTDAGLTQAELAGIVNRLTQKESGVDKNKFTQVQVSDLERGKSKRSVYLPHIAVACGVSAAYLAFGMEPVSQKYTIPADDDPGREEPAATALTEQELKILRNLMDRIAK